MGVLSPHLAIRYVEHHEHPLHQEREVVAHLTELRNRILRCVVIILLIFAPLIIGTLWLGFQPGLVLDYTAASVEALTTTYRAAIGG